MSTEPEVVITRDQIGNVMAEGGDALATTLLRRAGFVPESSIRQHWHRLPWELGEQRENEMASHAARMLTAVGYRVDLGPDLLVPQVSTPSDPHGKHVHGHQVLLLTDELNGAQSYAGAAELTEHVLDPNDGVLVRLGEFFEAAAEQAKASETEAGWNLSYVFEDAAATLAGLGEELVSASDDLRALGPPAPEPPRWQAKAAEHFAATPRSPYRHKDPGADASPAPQPSEPKSRHTR